MKKTYLKPIYDTRKSFYNKAVVEITNNEIILFSYNTKIATIKNNELTLTSYYDYSATTLRHLKEFLLQNNFKVYKKSELAKHYKVAY